MFDRFRWGIIGYCIFATAIGCVWLYETVTGKVSRVYRNIRYYIKDRHE